MSEVRLVDPFNREIILHDRTWYGHILRGHPEMFAFKNEVESTVVNPYEIRLSLSNSSCRVYYSDPAGPIIFAVIVDIELGLVKTAHRIRNIRGGELEWSRLTL